MPLRQAGAWGESASPAAANPPQRLWPTPAPHAALPSSSSRQLAGLPLLFLWASKSDVRHFAPPLNPPRAFKPFPAPLAYSCIAALLASGGSLGREPWNVQPVLLWASKSDVRHFKPLGSLAYSCTAALPSSSSRQLAGLPLLFLWASKSDVRHFAPPLNPPRAFKPFPAPLAYSCIAALLASGGSLGREPWNVQPVLLWASKSDVRHFAPPSNPPPRLQTLPSAFGLLLHRSLALFLFSAARRPASSSYGLPKATLGTLHRLQTPRAPSNPSQRLWRTPASQPCLASASGGSLGREPLPRGCKPSPAPLAYSCIAALPCLCVRREPGERAPPPRLQTLPSAFGLLLHRSLALFLFSAARRPASSLLMGFQKRR